MPWATVVNFFNKIRKPIRKSYSGTKRKCVTSDSLPMGTASCAVIQTQLVLFFSKLNSFIFSIPLQNTSTRSSPTHITFIRPNLLPQNFQCFQLSIPHINIHPTSQTDNHSKTETGNKNWISCLLMLLLLQLHINSNCTFCLDDHQDNSQTLHL